MKDAIATKDLNNGEGVNRYKFQPFKVRVESLKIDVVHRIRKVEEEPGEHNTFFNEALQSWKELNLTSQFVAFIRETEKYVQSLAQLLYHKEKIAAALETHLRIRDSLALEPLLDLVTKLAKDLEGEFYPYFEQIFSVILPLVNNQDVKTLEWLTFYDLLRFSTVDQSCFNCIAYLFKYLSKQIVADLCLTFRYVNFSLILLIWRGSIPGRNIFRFACAQKFGFPFPSLLLLSSLLAPLLGEHHQKPYIRHFAAEAFAFLIRKARGKDLTTIVHYMLESLRAMPTEEYVEGLAMVFFEAVKQVDNRLHSRGVAIMQVLVQQMIEESVTSESISQNTTFRMLSKTFILLLHHSKREHFAPLVDMLLAELDVQIAVAERTKKQPSKIADDALIRMGEMMAMLAICGSVRKASRISDFKPIFARTQTIAQIVFGADSTPSPFLVQQVLKTSSALLMYAKLEDVLVGGKIILDTVFQFKSRPDYLDVIQDPVPVLCFAVSLFKLGWDKYTQIMLPYIIKYSAASFNTHPTHVIIFLAHLLSSNALNLSTGLVSSMITKEGLLIFSNDLFPDKKVEAKYGAGLVTGLLKIVEDKYDWGKETASLNLVEFEQDINKLFRITIISAALNILPHVSIPHHLIHPSLSSLLTSLLDHLSSVISSDASPINAPFVQGSATMVIESLLGLTIEALAKVSHNAGTNGAKALSELWDKIVLEALLKFGRNEVVLRGVMAYLETLKSSYGSLFGTSVLEMIFPHLKNNISSVHHQRRLYTLRILGLFDQFMLTRSEGSKHDEPCEVLSLAVSVEEVEATVTMYREKTMQLRELGVLVGLRKVPAFYAEVVPRLCLGLLTINLQPLWNEAIGILERVCQIDPKTVWDIIYNELIRFDNEALLMENSFSRQVLSAYSAPRKALFSAAPKTGGLSFECPNHNKHIRAGVQGDEFIGSNLFKSFVMQFVSSCNPDCERMDYWNYYSLLLKALTQMIAVAEQHSRLLVPIFLEFVEKEYEPVLADDKDDHGKDDDDGDKDGMDIDTHGNLNLLEHSPKIAKANITVWLQLFAKFNAPRSIFKAPELYNFYLRLLTKGDTKVQALALDCLLTWKSSSIVPYADNLKSLVDEIKFRDELSTFALDRDRSEINLAHRAELMPIVVRILYGRMVARKGKGSAKGGMGARRTAVLGALVGCPENELVLFVDLMLEPFTLIRDLPDIMNDEFTFMDGVNIIDAVSWRKQIGYLHILEDVLRQLGAYLIPFVPKLLKAIMYMVLSSQNQIDNAAEPIELDNSDSFTRSGVGQMKRTREVRQLSIKRIVEFFKIRATFDFRPYLPAMFFSFINSRVPKLDIENTQAPSALMELFAVWTTRREYVEFLVDYNKDLLAKLFSIMSAKKLRDSVLTMVLEITENILELCADERELDGGSRILTQKVLLPHVNCLLDHLEHALAKVSEDSKFGKDMFSVRQIAILSQIATYVNNGPQATKLIDLLLPSLKKSPRAVPEKTKANILQIMANFLRIIPEFQSRTPLFMRYYSYISLMFSTLTTRECRTLLVSVFAEFARIDNSLADVAAVIADLNSYSARRLDEPDYDKRLDAFAKVTQQLHMVFDDVQWLPLLHNFLFSMQDMEEMSIRNNASFAVTRFIDRCADTVDPALKEKFISSLTHVIFPGIKKGMKSSFELVRMEYATILDHAVKKCPTQPQFADMVTLLADGDEEANFFNNIYHIQLHRRVRALTRLSADCAAGKLRPMTLANIFAPMVAHFIFESDKVADHNLINESVITMGVIAGQLPWGNYYTLLKQYLKLIPRKSASEKVLVRVVTNILDNFHFDLSDVEVSEEALEAIIKKRQKVVLQYMDGAPATEVVEIEKETEEPTSEEGMKEETEETEMNEDIVASPQIASKDLALRIHDIIVAKLLPELHRYVTSRDEASVMIRVPVALAITKLLRALPEKSMRVNLPGLLTSVCQILKSRQQEARDVTRETLIKISNFLGPAYFGFIIKELQGALLRGYMLHVLGFTLNSLLMDMVPRMAVGGIDYCLANIVGILINDVFGEVGEEKETEEIKNKMKEAKTIRSFESFELLAKVVEFKNMGVILLPIKELMSESESLRVTNKIDEVLRRLAIGLNSNPKFETKEMLIFSHGLISQNLELGKPKERIKVEKSNYELNFDVQMKRDLKEPVDYFKVNAHRFVEFGLSIFLSALKRSKFDVKDQEQLELLDPFVGVVGNVLYSKHNKIVILATKILGILCKLSLPSLDDSLSVIIKQMFTLIKGSGSTSSELVQSCFKLLTVCIRDCKATQIKENQLTFLINLIRPDLEDPDKQSTTFSLVRAVVSRKFVAPEVYDLMDNITHIMITSQGHQVRELCRHVFLQFLLDYPQGRGRLRNQMNFLVKNLDYVYESGRESVMEMLNIIMIKFGDDVLMEYAEMFFLALVMRLVNDDSAKCREMAGALIRALLRRMDTARTTNVYKILDKWFDQAEQQNLQRAACQVYGLVVEASGERFKKSIPTLISRLVQMLEVSKKITSDMEQAQDDNMEIDVEWEISYYALTTFGKVLKQFPSVTYSQSTQPIWFLINDHLLHPHAWVRLSSSRLFGVYFASIDPGTRMAIGTNIVDPYLSRNALRELASRLCLQLKSEFLSQDLGSQVVKDLLFIGKCFYNMSAEEDTSTDELDNGQDNPEEEEVEVQQVVATDEIDKTLEDGHNVPEDEATGHDESDSINSHTDEAMDQTKPKLSLFWLFKKLSFMARASSSRGKNTLQRTYAFQWFAAMANIIKPEEFGPYLIPIISPIYRIVNDETAKGQGIDELKRLGQEVLDHVQKRAGTTQYYFAYNKVRQRVSDVRTERRAKRAFQATSDPEARAKRRIQKNEMKRNSRKRKTADFAANKGRLTVRKNRKMNQE
ncbi:hypothetical protein BC936DRAFT_144478 [Jimgerdemannia flammicorona]|uniref:Uncharacterized protein n=1 Tax=Jimgerdemannia flammicorona TaxID=994334 RepID=A0A433DCD4_9FUNG|nr:hypothetical protein BC936DRAFT_144478 [Jimgerdemannia flammicorona]